MVLTLTADETAIVKKALLEHIGTLRDQARGYSAVCSPVAIGLCQQRARAEELLDRLQSPNPVLPMATRRAA